jgi:hypothetical protein
MIPTTGMTTRKVPKEVVIIIILAWYFDAKLNNKITRGSRINEEIPGFKETPASLQTSVGLIHLHPLTICKIVVIT